MSSNAPNDDELNTLLSNVLTETPTITRSSVAGNHQGTTSGQRQVVGVHRGLNEQVGAGSSYQARVNRLTFSEDLTSSEGRTGNAGTSNRQTSSLYIDLSESGIESGEGGLPMMSARSSGTSTIDSVLDVTPLYEVYCFPLNLRELATMCNQRQSGGVTACIRTNCKLNHRGPKVAFSPGAIVVARSSASVFISPSTNRGYLSPELIEEWKSTTHVLDDWNDLFRMVNAQETNKPITPAALRRSQEMDDFAKGWQPVVNPVGENEDPLFGSPSRVFAQLVDKVTLSLTEKFENEVKILNEADPNETEPTPLLQTGEWGYGEAFKRLESNVIINKSIVGTMSSKLDELTDALDSEMKVIYSRVERTECLVGPKQIPDNPMFDAPTVWGSISSLASAIDDIHSELLAIKAKNMEEIVLLELRMNKVFEDQLQEIIVNTTMMASEHSAEINEGVTANASSIRSMNDTILLLARGASKLKEEMVELRDTISGIKSVSGAETNQTEGSTVVSDISSIKNMIRNMGQRIDTVVDGRESKSVKFFGITFRGHTDAEAWVLENLDSESFGLIVDAHLVFEHIYHQAFSDDGALKDLNVLYKLKIDNITQGLAMSSFDYLTPRFFSNPTTGLNKKPKIKKPDSSHFDNIDTYEDWDLPIMGFRAKLKEELEEFQQTHIRMISESLSADLPAYRIATMSVQASVNWILSFVAYLDETYTETFRLPSFTTARAWQLVTQIGRRILTDVASSRSGVKKLFRVGDNVKIAQTMFWPMVQSHETMVRYKKANFKDDPAVSNEFMKFMATNSGSTDGLASISTKLTKMETDVKEAVRLCKGANTSATNSANKADELKRLVTTLTQRVTSLEKGNK